jgi:hypothetical protein
MVFVGALVAVLAPVGFISFYTSYVDVFESADDEAPPGIDEVPDEQAFDEALDSSPGAGQAGPPEPPGRP